MDRNVPTRIDSDGALKLVHADHIKAALMERRLVHLSGKHQTACLLVGDELFISASTAVLNFQLEDFHQIVPVWINQLLSASHQQN